MKRRYVLGVVLLLWALTGCDKLSFAGSRVPLIPTPTPQPTLYAAETVRVVCSESLESAVHAVASDFRRVHPEVDLVVEPRADTLALRELQQGDADVAIVSWLPGTLPETAWVQPAARDGLAIIVNPQNGLPGLTMAQLQTLFQDQLEDWTSWGGLPGAPQLVSRETSSGDYDFFQAWVMRDTRVSLNALMAPSSDAMLQFVADDQLAVGYVSTVRLNDQVRAVSVDGVPPAPETIAAGLYPLTRTIFAVTPEEPDGAARGFVQWMLASPGQTVLEAHGLAPAP